MKTVKINSKEINTTREIYQLFQNERIDKGDIIKILSDDKLSLAAFIVIIFATLINYMEEKKKRSNLYGNKILKDLFSGNKSSREIEKEIEKEYGINIKVEEENNFRKDWFKLASVGLEKAYSKDETDYSDVQVKEPNPLYQKK